MTEQGGSTRLHPWPFWAILRGLVQILVFSIGVPLSAVANQMSDHPHSLKTPRANGEEKMAKHGEQKVLIIYNEKKLEINVKTAQLTAE